jgi:AraC-like DNA-binding protein
MPIDLRHPTIRVPVRRAMEYMREGLAITIDDLANHANLDEFHLCGAFRSQIGMPPTLYLTHLRIARAKELLLSGEGCSSASMSECRGLPRTLSVWLSHAPSVPAPRERGSHRVALRLHVPCGHSSSWTPRRCPDDSSDRDTLRCP